MVPSRMFPCELPLGQGGGGGSGAPRMYLCPVSPWTAGPSQASHISPSFVSPSRNTPWGKQKQNEHPTLQKQSIQRTVKSLFTMSFHEIGCRNRKSSQEGDVVRTDF